jgi:hypothetical protein
MGRWRAGAVSVAWGALVACSGAGQSQSLAPQYSAGDLECLGTLEPYCCSTSTKVSCIGDFASAERCSSWPAGTTLMVYATPCQGMTAVRVVTSYSTYFVYGQTSTLLAVGDNSASLDPRSGAIGCGAGPNGFVIPTACADEWEGAAGAEACGPGDQTPSSVCH